MLSDTSKLKYSVYVLQLDPARRVTLRLLLTRETREECLVGSSAVRKKITEGVNEEK
jgi:hypothetical protein